MQVSNVGSKQKQMLKLREITVEKLESYIGMKSFLDENYCDDDRRIIAETVFSGSELEDATATANLLYIYSQACCACYRVIAVKYDDASRTDWYPMYSNLYEQLIKQLHENLLAKAKDEIYGLEALFSTVAQSTDEIREQILRGYNWEYDKEEMETERSEEERKPLKREDM